MDNVVYRQHNGKMEKVNDPKAPPFTNPKTGEKHGPKDRSNFVIVCPYGDWSGFRTLQACLDQLSQELLESRSEGFFSIVERL